MAKEQTGPSKWDDRGVQTLQRLIDDAQAEWRQGRVKSLHAGLAAVLVHELEVLLLVARSLKQALDREDTAPEDLERGG